MSICMSISCFGIVASPCFTEIIYILSKPPGVAFCLTRLRIRPCRKSCKNSAETEGMIKRGSENRGTTFVANAMPNKGVQATASSVRSCLASAFAAPDT